MCPVEPTLYPDPQCQGDLRRCPDCGLEVYPPTYHCPRCRRYDP